MQGWKAWVAVASGLACRLEDNIVDSVMLDFLSIRVLCYALRLTKYNSARSLTIGKPGTRFSTVAQASVLLRGPDCGCRTLIGILGSVRGAIPMEAV
jgi:hypothetical protein